MLIEPWNITLLGTFKAEQGSRRLERFRTHSVGVLLAYLAVHVDRSHPRELLMEMLWPDSEPSAGRHNLRQALFSLRRQLEPGGTPAGTVVLADHTIVCLREEACRTDLAEFNSAVAASARAVDPVERVRLLKSVISLYGGELLPGYYEDWVTRERERLAEVYFGALRDLTETLEQSSKPEEAIAFARLGVAADPLCEEMQGCLIRLYTAAGRPADALQQYQELESLLREELNEKPSAVTTALIAEIAEARTPVTERPARRAPKTTARLPAQPAPTSITQDVCLEAPRPSLPLYLTRFFGREEELGRLEELLRPDSHPAPTDTTGSLRFTRNPRLHVLTGPGGSGKTRLAVEAARRIVDSLKLAAWFVPLADLTDSGLIPSAIAEALRLPRSANADPMGQIVARLKMEDARGGCLLILDNFEQLLGEDDDGSMEASDGARLVRTLLNQTESLLCLITSRRVLGLAGEHEFAVATLPTPEQPGTPARLLEFSSVQMFVDRAQEVRVDFAITPNNADSIAGLCRRLEGIPLAIELAAARVGLLSPRQMLAQLDDRFKFLVSRKKDTTYRHRTLFTAIEWSYRLLSPDLQRFFARLSVFRGGWTLEMAVEVCEAPRALEYLEQLRDRSLIVVEETGTGMRCRMLETLREFAWEQLSETEQPALRRRLAESCLELAEHARPLLRGPEQWLWLERLEAEHDNMRTALEHLLPVIEASVPHALAAETQSAETGLRLAATLCPFWWMHSHAAEGYGWVRRALAQVRDCAPPLRGHAMVRASVLANSLGDQESSDRARAWLRESFEIFQTCNDIQGMAEALKLLGTTASLEADYPQARELLRQSLARYRELGDLNGVGDCEAKLGSLAWYQADYATARVHHAASLAIRRECGDTTNIARSLDLLGHVALYQGDYVSARALYEETMELIRQGEDRGGSIANSLLSMGTVARLQTNWEESRACFNHAILVARETGSKVLTAWAHGGIGYLARDQGDSGEAMRECRESLRLLQHLNQLHSVLGMIAGLATAAQMSGMLERAASLFGAESKLRGSKCLVVLEADRIRHERSLNAVRSVLGADAFDAYWEQGYAMALEQAIAYAMETDTAPSHLAVVREAQTKNEVRR